MHKGSTLFNLIISAILRCQNSWQNKLRKYEHEKIKSSLKFCGKKVYFQGRIEVDCPENISLGDRVFLGNNIVLRGRGGISVGENTVIAFGTTILSANHDYESETLPFGSGYIHKPVLIGRGVWIGANVVIIPGVSIGDGAIIGAGAVVTGKVEPLVIVGCQSMRILGYRNRK
ncbi:MAG TPA: acyltransferase [Planktothrix sp. UBA8407]|jgi:Acetyltransferase (isoleucine patch superfamily)|nr:acyltransferase [Planktothrix sp. UBA8407]